VIEKNRSDFCWKITHCSSFFVQSSSIIRWRCLYIKKAARESGSLVQIFISGYAKRLFAKEYIPDNYHHKEQVHHLSLRIYCLVCRGVSIAIGSQPQAFPFPYLLTFISGRMEDVLTATNIPFSYLMKDISGRSEGWSHRHHPFLI
jgi:hypothetical protein